MIAETDAEKRCALSASFDGRDFYGVDLVIHLVVRDLFKTSSCIQFEVEEFPSGKHQSELTLIGDGLRDPHFRVGLEVFRRLVGANVMETAGVDLDDGAVFESGHKDSLLGGVHSGVVELFDGLADFQHEGLVEKGENDILLVLVVEAAFQGPHAKRLGGERRPAELVDGKAVPEDSKGGPIAGCAEDVDLGVPLLAHVCNLEVGNAAEVVDFLLVVEV